MKSVIKVLIISILFLPQLANAIELNISGHFKQLGGSPKDNIISTNQGLYVGDIKNLMERYRIEKLSDENIDVEIGVSSNSLFLLITNKTQSFIQYKFDALDSMGKRFGYKQGVWFDLMPNEVDHLGGTPISIDNPDTVGSITLNIASKPKKFKSDAEKKFFRVVNAKNVPAKKEAMALLSANLFIKHVIFPNYKEYRKDPSKKKMKDDLRKVDKILNIIGVKRNKIGLVDVTQHLKRKYDKKIMGIYDGAKDKVVVMTGSSIPTTSMIRFNHQTRPETNYYFYSESVTDYAGELVGAAYSILFSENNGKTKMLFEKQELGYVSLIWISDLVNFSDTKGLHIMGGENNGVANFSFVAKLLNNKISDKVSFGYGYEGGHEPCPEDPFYICG